MNSIEQFVISRHQKHSHPVGIIAFAPFSSNPYKGSDIELSVLSGSKEEISRISKFTRVKKYLGTMATKKAFQKKIEKPDIMHLATHGTLSSGNPMNNRIFFHQDNTDSALRLHEVMNMTIRSRLVVLSACETGSGDIQEGEGIMSLTRGFHYAGTPALIMSLWPAFDKPSVQIMETFYSELSKNSPIADALRTAKLNYLNQAKSSESHPGLWANYQLSGTNDILPLKKGISWMIWAGIIIILIGLFFIRKRQIRKQ